jgi:diguanylate cyclase (GGDEF)-like protein
LLNLTLSRKVLTLFLQVFIYFFSFHCLSLQAETFSQSLKQTEKLIYQNINAAETSINNLSLQLSSASSKEKLQWLTTSLNISALNHNNQSAEDLKAKIPLLITGQDNKSKYWRQLLSVNISLILTPSAPQILTELEALEAEMLLAEDAFLSAYFYRTLYYALMTQDITDVGLDIAIKNIKQWQKLEEYYFALEMQLNITTIRINVLADVKNAKQLIFAVEVKAQSLEASRYLVSIEVLKGSLLAIQGEFKQAYDLLDNLLATSLFTISEHEQTRLHSNLAFLSFELKDFNQAIYFSRKVLSYTKIHTPNFIASSQVQLARALIEVQQYPEATLLLTEAKNSFMQKNDRYGLFDVDNINVDILYKDNNIEGLYRTAKSLIANITTPGTNNVNHRRIARAENAAHVEEQSQVVEALAQDNITQQEELTISKKVLVKKNQSLLLLSLLCIVFISLLVWVYLLLKKVKVLANTDSLTGIKNRRYGIELSEQKLHKYLDSSTNQSFAVVMMDLDHFKAINDHYGHDVGDKVIQLSVNTAINKLLPQDIFCRMGGEEFMFVLMANNRQEVILKVEDIRNSIYKFDVSPLGIPKAVSASFGLSFIENRNEKNNQPLAAYIIEADTALYQAKKEGRNQLSIFQ